MGDSLDGCTEIFVQDGVLLKEVPSAYSNYLNSNGTLYISETTDLNKKRFVEWKPNDVVVDSDIQDQEWAVVNTVQKRFRTLSGNLPPDYKNRMVCIKIGFEDIKSFRVSNKYRMLTLLGGNSEVLCMFQFQHGNCEMVLTQLKMMMQTSVAKRDRQHYYVLDSTIEMEQVNRSFAELNLEHEDSVLWGLGLLKNVRESPVATTLEHFARLTGYVYKSPEQKELDKRQTYELQKSITEYENATSTHSTHSKGEFEVICKTSSLPPIKMFPRCQPLTRKMWQDHQNNQGMIEDVDGVKQMIFRGGVVPEIRSEVWKFLLDYHPWNSIESERAMLIKEKTQEYYVMKVQWRSMTATQEVHFADYREKKSLVEKDVKRTDRTLSFYAGDNNCNLQMLSDILMTYIMYNFNLGYVQGMSDLLSPILYELRDEVDSFWCFVGFMNKLMSNFDIDQAGMKEQLNELHSLLSFVDSELASYLDNHESGNMFFCFRWLLVWFKREFDYQNILRLWEVLWTGLPCENFHLLISVAILVDERENLMQNDYGFTEILKHINELSNKLNVDVILSKAEGIYHQILEAELIPDTLKLLLGMPFLANSSLGSGSKDTSLRELEGMEPSRPMENNGLSLSPDIDFDQAIESNFL